jgi:tRNA(fMet)-specific endonuclease VapC
MIFLDANVVVDLLHARRPTVRRRLGQAQTAGESIGISSIVYFELQFGVANSAKTEDNGRALDAVLGGGIEVVPFDAEDAAEAGLLRSLLRKAGREIGPYDVLIAAQARRRGETLVTHNTKEFERVPGLTVVDWVE